MKEIRILTIYTPENPLVWIKGTSTLKDGNDRHHIKNIYVYHSKIVKIEFENGSELHYFNLPFSALSYDTK